MDFRIKVSEEWRPVLVLEGHYAAPMSGPLKSRATAGRRPARTKIRIGQCCLNFSK